ncbi:MAG: hypothetical protein AAGH72_13320 [Verrucomicrobiota bacterium]
MKISRSFMIVMGRCIFAGLLLIATIVVLAYVVMGYQGAKALQEVRQELAERGETLNWQELLPEAVPDQSNLAMSYLFKNLHWTGEISSTCPFQFPNIAGDVPQPKVKGDVESVIENWSVYISGKSGNGQTPEEVILNYLEAIPLDQLHQEAALRRAIHWPIRYEDGIQAKMPHVNTILNISRALNLRAVVYEKMNQPELAIQDLLLSLRLADNTGNNLISELVNAVVYGSALPHLSRLIKSGNVGEKSMNEIQTVLSEVRSIQSLQDSLRMERAIISRSILEMKSEEMELFVGMADGSLPWPQLVQMIYPRGWRESDAAFLIRCMQDYHIDPLYAPEGRLDIEKMNQLKDWLSENRSIRYSLSQLTLPAYIGVIDKVAHSQAKIDMILITSELARYQQLTGEYPESLQDLDVAASLIDPCSGQPYRYVKQPSGGYLLYSVGWNQEDDGGRAGTDIKQSRDAEDWLLP